MLYNTTTAKTQANAKWYWSNCIIEGIRAKIERPKKIKWLMIWPWQNEVWCPHLMWTDGTFEYDFHANGVPLLGWIWHRGYIRVKPLGWCRSYKDGQKALRRSRMARRLRKRNG